MKALKKNEQLEKIKFTFEELQKNLEDLKCKEHSKTKTIYVDKLPSNNGKGGFICEYCPNPTNCLKFYSNIIEENADLINNINLAKFSEKQNNLNEDEIKTFSDLSFQVDQRNIDFNNTLKHFDDSFIPQLFAKKYGNNELKKLKEIIKTISFNQKGKPIYENIGQNREREIQYVKLANILIALKDYKLNDDSKFSEGLYRHIENIIALRDNFVGRINEYMRFISGDFYQKIHEIDDIPTNENFLKNKKLFINEDDRFLLEFQNKLTNKDSEINFLNEKIKNLNAESEKNKNYIENLLKKNNEILSENNKQENLIKELQLKFDDTCVQSANSQDGFNEQMKRINSEFEKKIKKIQEENDKKNSENNSRIEELLEKNQKLKGEISSLGNENNKILEKNLNLQNEIMQLKNHHEKKLTEINNSTLLLRKEYEDKNNSMKGEFDSKIYEKIKLEKEIKNLHEQLEEAILTRKNLGDTFTDEKNQWRKNKKEFLFEIERLKKLNQNSVNLENLNKNLTKKIEGYNVQLEYLTKRNEELEKSNKNLKTEKEELSSRIENYILENNSLMTRLKSLNANSKNSQFSSELNTELLNDLKKQVAVNKTLNVEIENLHEKINSYNSRISTNESLIKNQLDLIKKYHEEKPILTYDKKSDLINSNRIQTESLINKIEKIERDPLKKSLNVPINDDNVESYIRNTITNSNPNESLTKSQMLMTENFAHSGNKYNLPAFRPSKVLYKINFSNDLLLNNSNWEMVRDWIDETNIFSTGMQPKLLYKATKDGFNAKNFQENCLNFQNVLIIAKTDFNKIIGGFTPLPFIIPDEPQRYLYDLTNSTFLFSVNEKEKYLIKKNMNAICLTKNHGPIFGSNDFEILDSCDTKQNNLIKFGQSFSTKRSAKEFFGNEKYLIKEYEVYQIL